ncbi:MAG: Ig-like domain-containing protein [Thermoplasmata archaeon]|nr:Ig-like domain-containing protein [Thermoplasmata archaeon]
MRKGSLRTILIAMLFLISGATSLLLTADENVDGIAPPPFYHNAYIHVNATMHNGTPAAGFQARINMGPTVVLDSGGEGTLNLSFRYLGIGTFVVRNLTFKTLFEQRINIEPDEVLYMNVTLAPPVTPYNVVTGLLLNATGMSPRVGVEVKLSSQTDFGDYLTYFNTTDEDGRYSFFVPNVTQYTVTLYVPSSGDLRTTSWYFFLREGVSHYEVDLISYKYYLPELESRARFVRASDLEPIPGSLSISLLSRETGYNSINTWRTGPDPDGWYNFSGAHGEGGLYFNPNPKLIPNASTYFSYSFLQNDTGIEMEIPVDLSNLVPVEITIRNSSEPIPGSSSNLQWSDKGGFGIYSATYNNKTDANGTSIIMLPEGRTYFVSTSGPGHHHRGLDVDTIGPGPHSFEVVLEEIPPPVVIPTTTVNLLVLDDKTGIPIPTSGIYGRYNNENGHFSFSGKTNSEGRWTGTINVGVYDYISGSSPLGYGKIEDVEVREGIVEDFTIRQGRNTFYESMGSVPYHFYVLNEAGEPVAGAYLRVSGQFHSGSTYSTLLFSDDDGRVDLAAVPGFEVKVKTVKNLPSGELNDWAVQLTTFIVEPGEERLPDVTAHRMWDPVEITGFIRDGETMEPISYQNVRAHSVKEMDDQPTRFMMFEEYKAGVDYMDLYRRSKGDGFYRSYGLETTILDVRLDGYFSFQERLQLEPTRGDVVFDILMDPLPEFMVWMNGTLVNENGDPIAGELNITDFDHPAMNGHDIVINETGEFSIELYPSNYTLRFFNETLTDTLALDLGYDGTEGLILQLIPYSTIAGQVVDWEGVPIEGLNVTLENEENTEVISWAFTDAGGNFSFEVLEGTYDIILPMTDLYSDYRVNDIVVNGWNDWWNRQYLANRTIATLAGTVLGSGGYYAEGIPDATVTLIDGEVEVRSVVTDSVGIFDFGYIDYGTYDLNLTPPEDLQPVEGLRSGYEGKKVEGLIISGTAVTVDPVLDYVVIIPPGYVNVTHGTPNGTDEYLDTPIVIVFSETMDPGSVEGAITISPAVAGLEFNWSIWGEMVTVYHDDLLPNTTYTVVVGLGAVSIDGWPLRDDEAFSWTFTTGDEVDPWSVASADVALDGMNLTITVEAPTNLTIYIMILNAGYHQLTEGPAGTYALMLDDSVLEHNRTYTYFFTDSSLGDDRAPAFAGEFTTPLAPVVPVVWEITSVDVDIKSTGDWMVEVTGTPGLAIFIVIDGVGSFELLESSPGLYQANVYYDNFEKGKTYDYHLSDEADGTDLAPAFVGSITDPRSESEEDKSYTCLLCSLILIVLILFLVFVVLLIKRRRSDKFIDDEE